MLRNSILIIIVCGLIACSTSKPLMVQKANVLADESARFAAMMAADTGRLSSYLHPDMCYIHSNAMVENKQTHLQAIVEKTLIYENIKSDSVQVRLFDDMAITNGIATVKGVLRGTTFSLRLRYTATYILQKKHYQLLNWQSTKIP